MDTPSKRVPLETTEPTPRPNAPSGHAAEARPKGGPSSAASPAQPESLRERVIAALHSCYDPEIPVDIYELGLIYQLDVDPTGVVNIQMTLTSPGCPVAGSLPGEVKAKVEAVPGVTSAQVEVVWDPPWDKSRMSEAAMLQLGLF
jgi:FeS assembly SUF system protein